MDFFLLEKPATHTTNTEKESILIINTDPQRHGCRSSCRKNVTTKTPQNNMLEENSSQKSLVDLHYTETVHISALKNMLNGID